MYPWLWGRESPQRSQRGDSGPQVFTTEVWGHQPGPVILRGGVLPAPAGASCSSVNPSLPVSIVSPTMQVACCPKAPCPHPILVHYLIYCPFTGVNPEPVLTPRIPLSTPSIPWKEVESGTPRLGSLLLRGLNAFLHFLHHFPMIVHSLPSLFPVLGGSGVWFVQAPTSWCLGGLMVLGTEVGASH